jgi:hypothetical protein
MSQPVSWGPPTERADAARNWRVLLATARAMLAEHGPDRLTIDAPAERAGVGKGTVFRRFGTRAGIFHALLDDEEREFQHQVLGGPPPQWSRRSAAGPPGCLRAGPARVAYQRCSYRDPETGR